MEGSLATLESLSRSPARSFSLLRSLPLPLSFSLSLALRACTRVHLIATPTETRIDTTHCSGNSRGFSRSFSNFAAVVFVEIARPRRKSARRGASCIVVAPRGRQFSRPRPAARATLFDTRIDNQIRWTFYLAITGVMCFACVDQTARKIDNIDYFIMSNIHGIISNIIILVLICLVSENLLFIGNFRANHRHAKNR